MDTSFKNMLKSLLNKFKKKCDETYVPKSEVESLRGPQGPKGDKGDTGATGPQGPAGATLNPYPVGSIYISENSTSPASLFGGTWSKITDRFLVGAGSSYSVKATGGEKTHTLTVNEMPSHSHNLYIVGDSITTTFERVTSNWSKGQAYGGMMTESGGGQAHNNMPPYYAVYIWRRTA